MIIDDRLEANFKVLNNKLDIILRTFDIFTKDLAKDRGDLNDFTVEVARLGAEIRTLLSHQTHQAEKISDAVEDAIEPVMEEAKGLKNIIKKKKTMILKPKGLLGFFKRG